MKEGLDSDEMVQGEVLDNGIQKYDYKMKIVWRNVMIMTSIHLMAVFGYYRMCTYNTLSGDLVFMVIMQKLCALGILAGAHRLWSHKSYKAHLPLRIFLAVFQTASIQNDIYEWCRDHRLHHKYSETDADPHNSKRGYFFAHMGWLLCKKHPAVKEKGKTLDMSDLWADPVVKFQRRFYIPFCCNMFLYIQQLHQTWLVNSSAHTHGMKPYDKSIEPRQNKTVAYLTLGEGYHNYHHTFPYDYSASEHGGQANYNPATLFIDFCASIGQAYDRRKVVSDVVENRKQRTGSGVETPNMNVVIDYIFGSLHIYAPFIFIYIIRCITAFPLLKI